MSKIGILAFWNKYGGGVYQYTQSIVDALRDDKTNSYVVFCFDDDHRFDNYNVEIRRIKEFSNPGFKKVIRFFQFLFFIQKPWLLPNDDLNKFHDIDLILSPCISEYPHFYLKKRFVFTFHDMQEKYYPGFFSRYTRFTRWLYNRTLTKTAKAIICESDFVKSDLMKFTHTNADKIFVIPSPPPKDFLTYKIDDAKFSIVKEKYRLPDRFIFYPAQCWEHKNHIRLVEAFQFVLAKHPDIHLILTGSQNDNYPNLAKKISQLNLENRIHHLGYIDYQDFPYLYKLSQFLVMPTLFESLSIPIYEAFALEVAVCSSNVVALPEQVGDSGLIFDPLNVVEMSEKMMLLLENHDLRKSLAKKGKERVQNFNHEKYKNQLLILLH